MKAHQEEMKDIDELKVNLGYPTTQRKGQIESRKKATSRTRVERLEEVAKVLKIEKLMTIISLSQVKTMLQDIKGEDPKKRAPEKADPKLERPSKKQKTRAQQEEEKPVQEEEGEEEEENRMDIDPVSKPKLIIKDPSPIKKQSP